MLVLVKIRGLFTIFYNLILLFLGGGGRGGGMSGSSVTADARFCAAKRIPTEYSNLIRTTVQYVYIVLVLLCCVIF